MIFSSYCDCHKYFYLSKYKTNDLQYLASNRRFVFISLQQYPMTENKTGPQTIEFLTKRVVALGAVQTGQFLVDCETYVSVPQLGECFHILKFNFRHVSCSNAA